jgi:hypothetical protein
MEMEADEKMLAGGRQFSLLGGGERQPDCF